MLRLMIAWLLSGLATALAAEANLLSNPSFEKINAETKLPAQWRNLRGGVVVLRTDGGHTGPHYVRLIDKKKDQGIHLESRRLPARPGGVYTASAWMRTTDKGRPGVYINFYDEFGQRIHNRYQRRPAGKKGWIKVTVSTTAPEEAETVSASIYSYVADVGAYDFDDVSLTVKGGREPGVSKIPRAEPKEKTMAEIASRMELFVDSFLIDCMTGSAQRRLHHPQPREIALKFDKPWEGRYCGYVTVLVDDGRIKLYYRGWPGLDTGACTCVAESDDGIHFTRPELGLIEWDGSKKNNIIWKGGGSHNFTPFKDSNPDCPPDQRYKALASGASKTHGLVPFVSPDGYRWRKLTEEPVITKGAFDSQNLAFWDSARGQYVAYFRIFKDGVRDIRRCVSKDFIHWTDYQDLDYGDAPKEHLYTNAITPYFRAPHLLIGLPCRFVPGRKKIPAHKEGGVNDGVLMSSRDGVHWERWVEGFLRPAPDPLCWTDRNNYLAWGMAQTSDSEISLYWNEHYRYPTHRLRRGVIRVDGFVSIHADAQGGEMLTRPFQFAGKTLVVNYATSAIGSLRFELCDAEGKPYEGFSYADSEVLFGDEIAHTVSWNGETDVHALAGKPVRLRVRLKDGDLFSFRFAE